VNQYIVLAITALAVGMNKTGLNGIALITLPLMAVAFGARDSSGLVLVLLLAGDLFGVFYYHKHAQWKHLVRLLPWAMVGVLLGVLLGNRISDETFKVVMGVIILLSVILMIIQEIRGQLPEPPKAWWIAPFLGVVGGFATMVGNAAAPVMALYMLTMQLKKNDLIGTSAWYFFLINLFKLPFHILVWKSIDVSTLVLGTYGLPGIVLGAFLGVWIVKRIPEKPYRYFVIVMTLVATVRLLVPT